MPIKVKLNISKLNAEDTRDKANAIVAAMTQAAVSFPTPNPALATITTAAYELNTLILQREVLETQLQQKTQLINNAADLLKTQLRAEAGYVEGVANANGNSVAVATAIVESAGMQVAGGNTPVGPMPKVTALSGTQGDEPGEVDLHWNSILQGSPTYVVQSTEDPAASTGWVNVNNPTPRKSKCSLGGFPSATRRWFRVAAVGTAGQGPYSDPVQVTVP